MAIPFLSPDMVGFLAVFLFVFALVYALLIYTKVLESSRKAVAAVAVAIGLVTAVYEPAVAFLTGVIPLAAIVLVLLFFLVFIKKMFFPDKEDKEGKKEQRDAWPAMLGMGIMLILLNVFWDRVSGYLGLAIISADTVLWVIGIIIIIMILIAAYSVWGEEKPG